MGPAHPIHSGEQALERLANLPGGAELKAAAREREDLALVGGAVRDLLLGRWPRELDVTVAGDAAGLARTLAASVSPSERAYGHAVTPTLHDRFGTASVTWDYGRIDVAERRAESYSAPGALPDVRPGSVEEDLARRDFTVNAISLPLAGRARGQLQHVAGALDDLAGGVLRVLHEESFSDDPTRILRLARYAVRLGFEIDAHTRALADAAIAGGALQTVSGGRVGTELWLAAAEAHAPRVFTLLGELGVLRAVGLPSPFDEELARAAVAMLPADGRRELLVMGVAFGRVPDDGEAASARATLRERLEFTREQSQVVGDAVTDVDAIVAAVLEACGDGVAYQQLDGRAVEVVTIAAALAERTSPAAAGRLRQWLATQRFVTLEIDGNDLIAAGLPEGPEIRSALLRALICKREGLASGREAELRAAISGDVARAATVAPSARPAPDSVVGPEPRGAR